MRLIVISGRSGSGKSAALNALEDSGQTCIDNLPASLLPTLFQRLKENPSETGRTLAVSIDVRNPWSDLQNIAAILEDLRESGVEYQVIYLDADTQTLFKRFSESRRKHPLSNRETDLHQALILEEQLLAPMKQIAEAVIDTSSMSPHELRNLLRKRLALEAPGSMQLVFESFGFKYGVPVDADFIFDVRCLPNPHWRADLRVQTGRDGAVMEFLESEPQVKEMQEDIVGFLDKWLSRFEEANRSYLTVAIGCTGGQHRSVYLADQLFGIYSGKRENVRVKHRELVT